MNKKLALAKLISLVCAEADKAAKREKAERRLDNHNVERGLAVRIYRS